MLYKSLLINIQKLLLVKHPFCLNLTSNIPNEVFLYHLRSTNPYTVLEILNILNFHPFIFILDTALVVVSNVQWHNYTLTMLW